MEERMTVCNMSIEGGARAGMVAPDDTTFEYLSTRPHAPKGAAWDAAVARWKRLPTDEGAAYDRSITIDAVALEPMITFGTNPGMGMPITRRGAGSRRSVADRDWSATRWPRRLRYMGLEGGKPLAGAPDRRGVHRELHQFAHLRSARRGGRAQGPQGEPESARAGGAGIAANQAPGRGRRAGRIFRAAGREWREPGCSMCIAMNGDQLQPGQYSVSTSNRNFEGRQGKGGRTFLASPLTAAASASPASSPM